MGTSLEGRPYIGTWRLNSRQVVKHTPDALVYVNGDTSLPGCPTCGGRIDIQKYITQLSVDPSTEGPATATISLHVPRHVGDTLFRDANFIIRPGLEVHIYLRGYFPATGILKGLTKESTGGLDLTNSVMYPYYLVFHGVTTEVNHEYSGGEHTATIQCADMLHFWQYQRISTSGSLFGTRPTNSKVRMTLVGHNLTGMSPFAIIYQLFRDVQGAAGGVEFALGNKTNNAAMSTVVGESLFSLSILYWQQRFSQTTTSLRMYGADGRLYNAAEAAYLASLSSADTQRLAKQFADKNNQSNEKDVLVKMARLFRFDPESLFSGSSGASTGGKSKPGDMGVNVAQLQAFVSDIGNWGQVNLFESQYATKLEIANTVKEAAGYEFYQDVDGDIVFKPPFYNLDTSDSRVYRIEEIDIISFSASEKEPEATVVKVTGSHFQNLKVPSIEGWVGSRAEFIDYRLVAQFGWRQSTFETSYHTNPMAMYFACIARFDLFNIGVRSASCTIPLRPELRPGFPVYIVPFDCFYYVHSFNHSFSFGGQCTTTLNLVGKRAKFFAPGEPPQDGQPATVDNIKLNNPALPALPIEILGNDDIPRLQGFPNVVMTLDPEAVNPLTFSRGIDVAEITTVDAVRGIIQKALASPTPVVQLASTSADAFDGPFLIQTKNGPGDPLTPEDLLKQAENYNEFLSAKPNADAEKQAQAIAKAQEDAAPLLALIEAAQSIQDKNFPADGSSAAYLELLSDLKASFSPGLDVPGSYRYYSSSHPDATMQGPRTLDVSTDGTVSTGNQQQVDSTFQTRTTGFIASSGGPYPNTLGDISVYAGIPLVKPGGGIRVTPTDKIKTFSVAQFDIVREGARVVTVGDRPGFPVAALGASYTDFFIGRMKSLAFADSASVRDSLSDVFDLIASRVRTNAFTGAAASMTVEFPYDSSVTFADIPGQTPEEKYPVIARQMAMGDGTEEVLGCASAAGKAMMARQAAGEDDKTLAQAWSACWPTGSPVQSGKRKGQKSQTKSEAKTYYVPVFPVSDERGYEVVGTYAYGRGLTIETGGSMQALEASTGAVDYDALETFIDSLRKSTNFSKAIGTKDPAEAATQASKVVVTLAAEAGVDLSGAGGTMFDISMSNRPSSTEETTQKISATNAAYSLADLGAFANQQTVCSCKGAEADLLLQAFDANLYVGVEDTDRVNQWLSDGALQKSTDWAAVQSAYRGTVLDTQSAGFGSAAASVANNWGNLISGEGTPATNAAIGEFESAAAALEAAGQQLAEDLGLDEEG